MCNGQRAAGTGSGLGHKTGQQHCKKEDSVNLPMEYRSSTGAEVSPPCR